MSVNIPCVRLDLFGFKLEIFPWSVWCLLVQWQVKIWACTVVSKLLTWQSIRLDWNVVSKSWWREVRVQAFPFNFSALNAVPELNIYVLKCCCHLIQLNTQFTQCPISFGNRSVHHNTSCWKQMTDDTGLTLHLTSKGNKQQLSRRQEQWSMLSIKWKALALPVYLFQVNGSPKHFCHAFNSL